MDLHLFYATLAAYALAMGLVLGAVLVPGEKIGRAAFYAALAGFAVHTLAIVARYVRAGTLPATSLFETTLFFTWTLMLVYLVVEGRTRTRVLGAFVIPFVFIALASASHLPKEAAGLSPALRSVWFRFHALFILAGHAAFVLAGLVSLLYLFHERALKAKRITGWARRLPPLELLDQLSFRIVSIGFPLVTIGIISGSILATHAPGLLWFWDPKQLLGFGTWLLYGLIMSGRIVLGWRGHRASVLGVAGLGLILAAFFGVALLYRGLHTFV